MHVAVTAVFHRDKEPLEHKVENRDEAAAQDEHDGRKERKRPRPTARG